MMISKNLDMRESIMEETETGRPTKEEMYALIDKFYEDEQIYHDPYDGNPDIPPEKLKQLYEFFQQAARVVMSDNRNGVAPIAIQYPYYTDKYHRPGDWGPNIPYDMETDTWDDITWDYLRALTSGVEYVMNEIDIKKKWKKHHGL